MHTAALGQASWLDDLTQGVVSSVQRSATDWLIQQYATLHALPARLRGLEQLRTAIARSFRSASAVVQSSDENAITLAGSTLAGLAASYPEMIAQVDRAFGVVQQAGGGAFPTGTKGIIGGAAVVYDGIQSARQFTSQVDTVDSTLKSVVDHLLATGALTPAQARDLYQRTTADAGWGKYLLYAVGAFVAWKIVKAIL